MNLETVEKNGQKFVLVPIEQYNQLLEELEMLEDIRDFRRGEKPLDEESFPGEVS